MNFQNLKTKNTIIVLSLIFFLTIVSFFIITPKASWRYLLSVARVATVDEAYPDYTYTLINSGTEAEISGYTGSGGGITIPSSLGGVPVTSIGPYAFQSNNNITSIIIPDGVTIIRMSAFSYCRQLSSITIPASVTYIWDWVFNGCSNLKNIIFNSTLAIRYNTLTGFESLESVTVGSAITSIDNATFDHFSALNNITVSADNPYYSSQDGVLFNKDATTLVKHPGGLTGSYTIPNTVTTIASNAFASNLYLTSVTIPDSVTSIGDYAFGNTGLTSITIPDSVTSIGSGAFSGSSNITSVTLGSGVANLSSSLFDVSNLASITVSGGNSDYSSQDGVLFNADKTTLVRYPQSKTGTSYAIPSSVTSIADSAFKSCSNLISIIIPNSVASIGASAFNGCSSITSIKVPDGVTAIGSSAFANDTSLSKAYFWGDAPTIGDGVFSNCASSFLIYYFGEKNNWTDPWNTYIATTTASSSSSKLINSFSFSSPSVSGTISNSSSTILISVPAGTDLTNLVPVIIVNGFSVSPASDVVTDFSNPVVYTVTAFDSSTSEYTVYVSTSKTSSRRRRSSDDVIAEETSTTTSTTSISTEDIASSTSLVSISTSTQEIISPNSDANSSTKETETTSTSSTTTNVANNVAKSADIFSFSQTMSFGFINEEVKKLQNKLMLEGFYDGSITGYFDVLTQSAVQKYQQENGIYATGIVGPITLDKLNGKDISVDTLIATSTQSYVFDKSLIKTSLGNDVIELQKRLVKEGFYSGPITGYFGTSTESAVGKLQEANSIVGPNDDGYGMFGPLTRAFLNTKK